MTKKTVTPSSISVALLSGWGQKYSSLEPIFDAPAFKDFTISSLDYSSFDSLEKFFSFSRTLNPNPDIVVGWSLGGQLSVSLIAEKIFSTKLLVLIAPPFQMIKDSRVQAGMSQTTFEEFYNNFCKAPNRTLKQFSILTAMNDKNSAEIARNLDINDENTSNLQFWLEELKRFSCFDVDFQNMPRVVFFHGAGDMITHISQSKYFQDRIKNFRLEIFKNCGHAPHLSHLEEMQKIILEEAKLF